jgi:hypothetical protein
MQKGKETILGPLRIEFREKQVIRIIIGMNLKTPTLEHAGDGHGDIMKGGDREVKENLVGAGILPPLRCIQ